MKDRFVPQPYPVYAIPLQTADFPARFRAEQCGVQLVVGWLTDDDNKVWPTLGSVNPYRGPVIFVESREIAERTVALLNRGDAEAIREAGILKSLDR